MNSPEYIQTSLAAAISLGLENGSFKEKVKLTGLNLLLTYDDNCIGRCAYCGLSAQRNALVLTAKQASNITSSASVAAAEENFSGEKLNKSKTFIRVKWPIYKLDDLLERTIKNSDKFERICISMITKPKAYTDTLTILRKIRKLLPHPISILIAPTIIKEKNQLKELKLAGADMIGVAIDTATKELFDKYRSNGVNGPHKWEKYWNILEQSIEVFGKFNAGIHLIAGLGETEKEMVQTIWKAYFIGAKTHLFSFYPEAYSLLENLNPPELFHYRKIQIARYLINEKNIDIDKIKFDKNDRIVSFDYNLEEIINEGYTFVTSGCPGKNKKISACNRPLANERPSETFRNYPYLPDDDEKELIRNQIKNLEVIQKI